MSCPLTSRGQIAAVVVDIHPQSDCSIALLNVGARIADHRSHQSYMYFNIIRPLFMDAIVFPDTAADSCFLLQLVPTVPQVCLVTIDYKKSNVNETRGSQS